MDGPLRLEFSRHNVSKKSRYLSILLPSAFASDIFYDTSKLCVGSRVDFCVPWLFSKLLFCITAWGEKRRKWFILYRSSDLWFSLTRDLEVDSFGPHHLLRCLFFPTSGYAKLRNRGFNHYVLETWRKLDLHCSNQRTQNLFTIRTIVSPYLSTPDNQSALNQDKIPEKKCKKKVMDDEHRKTCIALFFLIFLAQQTCSSSSSGLKSTSSDIKCWAGFYAWNLLMRELDQINFPIMIYWPCSITDLNGAICQSKLFS